MRQAEQQVANRYYDRHFQMEAVKVLPGEYFATRQPLLLTTLLGSCVAACLMDRQAGVYGMNHFLLPQGTDMGGSLGVSARFGVHAMELLITDMQKLGAQRHRLEAKVFGAGNVLDGMSVVNIGERNTLFVRDYLRGENIPIVAEDLLGDCARKVFFFPDGGKVLVKKLKKTKVLLEKEQAYSRRLDRETASQPGGDIDLFV
ncbi:chemoreceptor glutamine deamidase CheD [uncultured Aquitalea sp.]|uniref:chemoreceptor glutamine deamidase CheD n=1 Tax=uncultured Aquitalea sp. TaxID=540272 RepID=UPI0025DBF7B9|nr:chemoreceptor glutamine deamidase CheD [uncultured Aquitalea sp.]